MKKQRALIAQFRNTSYMRLLLNNHSLFIFSNILRNVGQFVVFFSSFFAYPLRMWTSVAPKNFEAYISTCILARAMKLSIQALQRYIILFKNS